MSALVEEEHALEHAWAIWEARCPEKKNLSEEEWANLQQQLCEFDTVEGFWRYFDHIPPPSEVFYDGRAKKRVGSPPNERTIEAFSLFNGSITGTQVEIVPNERIVQDWRSSSWPEGVHSRVVITFSSPSEGRTVMRLKQTGIPEEDDYGNSNTVDVTLQGWRQQIWGRVRQPSHVAIRFASMGLGCLFCTCRQTMHRSAEQMVFA